MYKALSTQSLAHSKGLIKLGFSFLKNIFLFIYLWLRWVFACGAQASHCSGFPCCGAQALAAGLPGSVVVESGLAALQRVGS